MRSNANADWKDLNESIHMFRTCLVITGPGHPARGRSLINLGNILHTRYRALGSRGDLFEAADLLKAALGILPKGNYQYDVALLNLISLYLDKFDTGDCCQDLTEAIQLSAEWVDSSKNATSVLQSSFLGVAAEAHLTSYMHFGDVSKLREAIDLLSIADDVVPACRRHYTLCDLASAQRLLYCHT